MRLRTLAVALAASLVTGSAAHAVTGVLISASGTWSADAPTTAISAPNAAWTLSFLEPDPLYSDPGTISGMGWATGFAQSLTYTLGGSVNSSVFSQAVFYNSGNGGGLDVSFNSSADTLSIYSDSDTPYADEDTGLFVPQPFSEAITESYNDSAAAQGIGSISITAQDFTPTNPNNPAIPEPASWVLMLVGLALTGAAMRGPEVVGGLRLGSGIARSSRQAIQVNRYHD